MTVFGRIVLVVVVVPLAVILIALAVANRGAVAFTLDPFNPGNPALSWSLPLFVLLFASLVAGLLIGSLATWLRQGRYRKLARRRSAEAEDLRTAVARDAAAGKPALPPVQG